MAPIWSKGTACLAHTPKKSFWHPCLLSRCATNPPAPHTSSRSAHRLYVVMMSCNLKSLFSALGKFYKYKTSIDQNFIIERVIIDFVCSLRRPVNSFTDDSFIFMGEIFSGPQGNFSLQLCEWPLTNWTQGSFPDGVVDKQDVSEEEK